MSLASMHRFSKATLSNSINMVECLIQSQHKVAVITLNRPKQLNALCDQLMKELSTHLNSLDANPDVKAIVITGSERAFAAGADIKELSNRRTFAEVSSSRILDEWNAVTKVRKPIIAAVNGFALGGGCELAMMCDIIIAGNNAQFGLPEIMLGTIPGCGGTQRLVRAIGKSKAMEMILSGSRLCADDAERAGLISRVVPTDKVLVTATDLARKIASYSSPAACLAKQAINSADDMHLQAGLSHEKSLFYSTWALDDRREGMRAFTEKQTAPVKDC